MTSEWNIENMPLTILMYHYVDSRHSCRCPQFLELENFRGQLGYLEKYYSFISLEDVLASCKDRNSRLPANALLLTFDDGLRDHYENVFPVLREKSIQGVFFPVAKAVRERVVLDVHKIQYILAVGDDPARLVEDIRDFVNISGKEYDLESMDYYYNKWAHAGRWDSAEKMFVKRMLQKGLPETVRSSLVQELFERFVTDDEADFSQNLYANAEELKLMHSEGMAIGSHGYSHRWLNMLSVEEQELEIEMSLEFLESLGVFLENWSICYPFGGYNSSLLSLLQRKKCALGFAINTGLAYLDKDNPLLLSRLDTNDLPTNSQALVSHWTEKVLEATLR